VYREETPSGGFVIATEAGTTQGNPQFTQDWQEAQRLLRERSSRDNNALDVIRKGEKLSLEQWAISSWENYSKPPVLSEKTHQVNLRVAKHLKNAFASRKLVDITADDIEIYLMIAIEKRFESERGSATDNGSTEANHSSSGAFRRPSGMLNVAVRKNSFKPILLGALNSGGSEGPFSPSLRCLVRTTPH